MKSIFSKINAKYTYDSAVLEGQQAEAVYNSAIKEAENKLKKAQDAVTEALRTLEHSGVTEYRQGDGSYVACNMQQTLSNITSR